MQLVQKCERIMMRNKCCQRAYGCGQLHNATQHKQARSTPEDKRATTGDKLPNDGDVQPVRARARLSLIVRAAAAAST